jgi:hypothetical protein
LWIREAGSWSVNIPPCRASGYVQSGVENWVDKLSLFEGLWTSIEGGLGDWDGFCRDCFGIHVERLQFWNLLLIDRNPSHFGRIMYDFGIIISGTDRNMCDTGRIIPQIGRIKTTSQV